MRGTIHDEALGAGNVPFWLRDRGEDLTIPRLVLDRPWTAPDGTSKTSLSLADIVDFAAAYRQLYEKLGVRAGDVVVTRLKSPIEVYLHWIALASNGSIAAAVNPRFPDDALKDYAHRIRAVGEMLSTEVTESGATKLGWRAASSDERLPLAEVRAPTSVTERRAEHRYRPHDIVLLVHTSGTTGAPKAVTCSHHGFLAGIRSQMRQPTSPLMGSTVLSALPAAHHSWFMTVTWALLSGTQLILASDQTAQTLVADVERFKPDSIRSFSCTLREVARLKLRPGALRSVGLWMSTGDVCRPGDIAAVSVLGTHPVAGPKGISRSPGMFVLDGFGSTELGHLHFSVLHAPGYAPGPLDEARCIGRPASFASAAILDASGRELPHGEVGYLAVRSDAVTPGYWNDPEGTAKSQRSGFWMTGDIAYRNALNQYFHLDRRTDVIETPDGPVYSVLTEAALTRSIPEIERCVVVGRPSDDGGVRLVCLLESSDSARDSDRWHRDVNAALAQASFAPVAETITLGAGKLPLTATGKIRKFLARSSSGSAAAG